MAKKRNRHPLWAIWHGMRQRCTNNNRADYKYYGQRGIIVCPAWRSLNQFIKDVGQRPTPKHTIDRIENDGPYCPFNCRWATKKEQMQNTKSTLKITNNRRAMSLSAWAEEMGMSVTGLHRRWHTHGTLKKPRKLEDRLRPYAHRLGISVTAICRRIKVYGWPLRRALTERKTNCRGS